MKTLYFNGVDADTGAYRRPPVRTYDFLRDLRAGRADDELLAISSGLDALPDWADANRLDQAGWGVVIHEDESPAVLEALTPLLSHRRAQAPRGFRCWRLSDLESRHPQKFLSRLNISPGDMNPHHRPFYLLIIGRPTRISYRFQHELSRRHAVGRLAFDQPADYATYAYNVVASEVEGPCRSRQISLFAAEHDPLTQLCARRLVMPLAQTLDTHTDWRVSCFTGPLATKYRLCSEMEDRQGPALIFTAGHGLVSRDAAVRLRGQGALICADWPGLDYRLYPDHILSSRDVDVAGDYRGSMLFHFGCFSAGTPEWDSFSGERRVRLHEKPFVASFPKRLLACNRGPLAVIGEADQAFQYSFLWSDKIQSIEHYTAVFYKLMQGERLGHAMTAFRRRPQLIQNQIAGDLMERGFTLDLRLRAWVGRHDARHTIILGDPAVKLQPR